MDSKPKRPVGRPRQQQMPPRIDASPEEIARVFMNAKPKTEWKYMKDADAKSGD